MREDRLKEMKQRFDYYPYDRWIQAAVKVVEGSDGMVVAGTRKEKTTTFRVMFLGLAAELSGSGGHCTAVSPLKALECDQACIKIGDVKCSCQLHECGSSE